MEEPTGHEYYAYRRTTALLARLALLKRRLAKRETTIQSQSEQITELTVGFENLLRAYKGIKALSGPDFVEKEAETILQKYSAQSDN